jgi:hypothetical protein
LKFIDMEYHHSQEKLVAINNNWIIIAIKISKKNHWYIQFYFKKYAQMCEIYLTSRLPVI